MLLYSLLKTHHFPIPLSVTVSKAQHFRSPAFLRSDDLKPSENFRKVDRLKLEILTQFLELSIEISTKKDFASSNRKQSLGAPTTNT